jgi:hypothetical protein
MDSWIEVREEIKIRYNRKRIGVGARIMRIRISSKLGFHFQRY